MRLIPPIWLLLSLIAVVLIARFVPALIPVNIFWITAGYIIIVIGLGIVFICAIEFRRRKTAIHPGHTPTTLICDGPYQFSRNPIYLAMAVIIVGASLASGNLVSLPIALIFIGIISELFIKPEEAILRSEFGQGYEDYCQSTHRWL